MIYFPEKNNVKALDAKIGVKFCQDTIILQSFLDQNNIDYCLDDLEKTPLGFGLRIKKENK